MSCSIHETKRMSEETEVWNNVVCGKEEVEPYCSNGPRNASRVTRLHLESP